MKEKLQNIILIIGGVNPVIIVAIAILQNDKSDNVAIALIANLFFAGIALLITSLVIPD